jgi:protein SCO1/2
MSELNRKLGRTAGAVQLVSFSVVPDYDQPAVLAEYAGRSGADSSRWKFLTGPKDSVDGLVVKGLLQPLANDPAGTPAHSVRFVMVDGSGMLRGFQDGNDPEVVQKLLMDIGDLLRERNAGKP